MRINKYLSDAGACSRREADRLVEAGRVLVDGRPAVLGTKVREGQSVLVDGKELAREEEEILLAFHKPRGVVCTTSRKEPDNIVDFLHYGKRIYPIGRLDKESEGLVLLTNQGELADAIARGSNRHEKEYLVDVDRPFGKEFLDSMARGVYLRELDVTTRPCKIARTGERSFRIVLTQGLNRQIRRMCEALGYETERLKRIRVMSIELGRLRVGTYRKVAGMERHILLSELEGDREGGRSRR